MSGLVGFAIVIGIIAGIGKGIEILISDSKKKSPSSRTPAARGRTRSQYQRLAARRDVIPGSCFPDRLRTSRARISVVELIYAGRGESGLVLTFCTSTRAKLLSYRLTVIGNQL